MSFEEIYRPVWEREAQLQARQIEAFTRGTPPNPFPSDPDYVGADDDFADASQQPTPTESPVTGDAGIQKESQS